MLTRIYIDNYKSLVNFELSVGRINLILGPNGSGKTTIFDVLRKLVDFACGKGKVRDLFLFSDCTRWQTSPVQSFELDIESKAGLYRYELAIEHDERGDRARVKHERLWLNGKPLLKFELNADQESWVQLYRDNHSEGPKYPFDWFQSAVASIFPRRDNTFLTWFKESPKRFIVLQIMPPLMSSESSQEESQPTAHLENYVSWYRHLSRDQGVIYQLAQDLREILPGFDAFRFEQLGEQSLLLKVLFRLEGSAGLVGYRFAELSDGQRALIALYTLLHVGRTDDDLSYTLCLDEPENFVALSEIQPWLTALYDNCEQGKVQALLISHHPELINYLLASPVGYWLEHESNRPTRARRISADEGNGMPVSELIARGWLHE